LPEARISNYRIHYHIIGNCAILRPDGPCDASRTEALARLVSSSLVESKSLVLDLSRADYVETPGFRWIVRQFRQLEAAGRALIVVGLPPTAERAFRLLRLDEIVPIARNVPEALEKLRALRVPALI
jgi:anti-anti-sigma factor